MQKYSAIVRLACEIVILVIGFEKAVILGIEIVSKVANCLALVGHRGDHLRV